MRRLLRVTSSPPQSSRRPRQRGWVGVAWGRGLGWLGTSGVPLQLRREAERNVAAVMGELGALRASMSGREEELCTHLSLLKEELLAEQSARGKLEAAFAAARTTALQEVGQWSPAPFHVLSLSPPPPPADLEGLKGQLDQEISAKEEVRHCRARLTGARLTAPPPPPPPSPGSVGAGLH